MLAELVPSGWPREWVREGLKRGQQREERVRGWRREGLDGAASSTAHM